MTETVDLSLFARPSGDGTLGMDLAVEGIACGACIGQIERRGEAAARRHRGAAQLTPTAACTSTGTDGALKPAQIIADAREASAITAIRSRRCAPSRRGRAEARRLTRCLAVAGFAAMNIMLLSVSVWSGNATDITPETRDFFHWASALIALPAAAYAGQPFFASAWRALRARALNMDVPISLGVILALGMSLVETAQPRQGRLFRFRGHAAVLPAGRARARPRHAAQDAGGRRQSGGAEGRDRAPLRRR